MDLGLTLAAINGFLILAYVGGVALRVVWPYALKYFETGEPFDFHYLFGQIIAALIGLLGVMSQSAFLGDLGAIGYFGAFVAGYGASSMGRESQKTSDQIRS